MATGIVLQHRKRGMKLWCFLYDNAILLIAINSIFNVIKFLVVDQCRKYTQNGK